MSGSKSHLASMAAALVLLAATLDPGPLGAGEGRAAVTRPSGGSSAGGGSPSSGSSVSGSGSSGGHSSGSGRSTISNDSRGSAGPTRPSGDAGGRSVIQDDRRTLHGHHGHHGHHGGIHLGFRGYYPWHRSWYWGPWGYGSWGYGWGHAWGHPYGYGYPGYPVSYAASPGYGMGALDLDVRPKDAEVHVNGQYVGLVRQYDGFPGYLWLERGTYEIAFYRPGHQTVTRPFEVFTGLVLDVSIDLPPGEAVLPARSGGYAAPQGPGGVGAGVPAGAVAGPASVRLEVLPPEASVYLDGRFVGTGEELARLHDGLIAEPGAHVLEVVGPGRVPETVHFELVPGEEARIEVRLDPAADA